MKRIYFIYLVMVGCVFFLFFRFYSLVTIPLTALSLKLKDLRSEIEEKAAWNWQRFTMRTPRQVPVKESAAPRYWSNEDRRSEVRSPVDISCVVAGFVHGQRIHESARVININPRGMYIEAGTPLDEGSNMKVRIKAMRFGKTFRLMGKVLRSSTRGMAVNFADIVQGRLKFILSAR